MSFSKGQAVFEDILAPDCPYLPKRSRAGAHTAKSQLTAKPVATPVAVITGHGDHGDRGSAMTIVIATTEHVAATFQLIQRTSDGTGDVTVKGLGRKRPSLAVELEAETIFEIATLVRPTDQVELVERSGRRGVERGQKCGFESVDAHVLAQSVHVNPLRRVFVGTDIIACAAADVVLPGPFLEARLSSGQGEKDALSLQKLWHMIELA